MKNKTILVTGAKGFIGPHLIKELLRSEYDVIPFDIEMGGEYDIFHVRLEEFIRKADVVIHLAALTSVEQSFKDPTKVFRVNVLGTARVTELCLKHQKKLIFPSSGAVYHPELSPYAHSKLLAEQIVTGIAGAFSGVVLRLFNVFGFDMNPNSGSIMYNFLTAKELIVFGDGEQTRDFVHVRDVVSIMVDAIENKEYEGKILDIGTGNAFTVNYVAGLFAYFRNLPLEYKEPRREIKWSLADTQMLKSVYKKPLTTNLGKDIKELVNYYYEN